VPRKRWNSGASAHGVTPHTLQVEIRAREEELAVIRAEVARVNKVGGQGVVLAPILSLSCGRVDMGGIALEDG
jgi:hypothetical protein